MSLLRANEQSFTTALQLQGLPAYPSKVHLNTTAISQQYFRIYSLGESYHQLTPNHAQWILPRSQTRDVQPFLHLWKSPSFHVILPATMTHYHYPFRFRFPLSIQMGSCTSLNERSCKTVLLIIWPSTPSHLAVGSVLIQKNRFAKHLEILQNSCRPVKTVPPLSALLTPLA